MSQHTNVRSDAVFQPIHLPGLADASFDDAPLVIRVQFAQGKWNADLAVVTARTSKRDGPGGNQLKQPLFNRGLSIAPSDGNDGSAAGIPPEPGELLPCRNGVFALYNVGVLQHRQARGCVDNEIACTGLVGLFEECMAIVPIAGKGHKTTGAGLSGFEFPGILGQEQRSVRGQRFAGFRAAESASVQPLFPSANGHSPRDALM